MRSPETMRAAIRATYEELCTSQQAKPSRSALAQMRSEPMTKFDESRCVARSDKRAHIGDIWENGDYLIE